MQDDDENSEEMALLRPNAHVGSGKLDAMEGGSLGDGHGGAAGAPAGAGGEGSTGGRFECCCWGCGLRVALPTFSPIFKCGFCGAYTTNASENGGGVASLGVEAAEDGFRGRRGRGRRKFTWAMRARWIGDRVVIAVIFAFMCSIIVGGLWAIFPLMFPTWASPGLYFHCLVVAVLGFNVLFNYVLAVVENPGYPPEIEWGTSEVGCGGLDNYTFCEPCGKPKPGGCHHCRQCAKCIMDMDHHCPFVATCVGAGNHRPFLLFLFWTILSCVYILPMAVLAAFRLWPKLQGLDDVDDLPFQVAFSVRAFGTVLASVVQRVLAAQLLMSFRAFFLLYLIGTSVSVGAALGSLLGQQVYLILSGKTYIESIQNKPARTAGIPEAQLSPTWREHMSRVFGKGPVWTWPLPRLRPPPGSNAHKLKSKRP